MTLKLRPSAFRASLHSASALLLTAAIGLSQAPERSPSDLIRYLTWQSDRPGREDLAASSNACGTLEREGQENQPAIRALVEFGTSAIPDLEAAFDVIEARGLESGFAGHTWPLFRAYAEIKGPAAYPRLRKMIVSSQFDSPLDTVRAGLDSAIASSFGLTSYVSAVRTPVKTFDCDGDRPQDVLDQLILAWERDDRAWLEQRLGPDAATALGSLLYGRTWADMRGQLWGARSDPDTAVGYRFQDADVRSALQPADRASVQERVPLGAAPSRPLHVDLDTLFMSASGSDCGAYRVRFYGPAYLVDNPDLAGLLRVIASCGAGPHAPR